MMLEISTNLSTFIHSFKTLSGVFTSFKAIFSVDIRSAAQGGGEVANIGNHRRRALLRCLNGRANPLMDPKVAGVVFF